MLKNTKGMDVRITDWNDAYANRDHIPGADGFIEAWQGDALAYREAMFSEGRLELDVKYGEAKRNRMDLFHPVGKSAGLVVFVHGGYWRAFDKSYWSHFAAGCSEAGWSVVLPSYTLAPEARISDINQEVTAAVAKAAELVSGPIRLVGHSAGGHLVTRLVCRNSGLSKSLVKRIRHVVSISGVHDLRPLIATEMNVDFGLDEESAAAESPALLRPLEGARVTAWVGADERPEFVRQTTLLANIWTGLGADMAQVKETGRHHFDVIDGLKEPGSPLLDCVLG